MKITAQIVADYLGQNGAKTRDEIQAHFGVSQSTATNYISAAMGSLLYIAGWRRPASRGHWSPLYARRTSPDQRNAPRPLRKPQVHVQKVAQDERRVRLRTGIDPRHVAHAAALGMWGALTGRSNGLLEQRQQPL